MFFPPCNNPSCSCPQTSRTARRPIEQKCAVLKHFPDPTLSELEWSWQRRPAEMDLWLFQEQPDSAKQGQYRGWCVPDSECSAFLGKLLHQGPPPAGSCSDSTRLTQVLPAQPLLSALLSINIAVRWKHFAVLCTSSQKPARKAFLKKKENKPLFIYKGLQQYPNICL